MWEEKENMAALGRLSAVRLPGYIDTYRFKWTIRVPMSMCIYICEKGEQPK